MAGFKWAPDSGFVKRIALMTASDHHPAISDRGVEGSVNAAAMDETLPRPTIQNVPKASPKSSTQDALVDDTVFISCIVSNGKNSSIGCCTTVGDIGCDSDRNDR